MPEAITIRRLDMHSSGLTRKIQQCGDADVRAAAPDFKLVAE
jgi:hypothetical protein